MDSKLIVELFCTLISSIILDEAECSTINKEEKQKYSSIPTEKTVYNETYDCVNIDKQPALRDLEFIDHQVKISPRKKYVDLLTDGSFKYEGSGRNLWLEKGCPFRTLPIARATGEQLGRDKFLYPEALNYSTKNNSTVDCAGAIVRDGGRGYYGLSAVSSVHKIIVAADSHQWSSGSIIIENGDNQIQAGVKNNTNKMPKNN